MSLFGGSSRRDVRPRPQRGQRTLLTVDSIINLLLGGVLLAVPGPAADLLGLPLPATGFYARVLGGVLVGIGLALLLERNRRSDTTVSLGKGGLGLGGAVVINICGGVAVALWLVVAGGSLPARGQIFLWGLVTVLIVLSAIELRRALR